VGFLHTVQQLVQLEVPLFRFTKIINILLDADVTVSVNLNQNRRPINPEIYGVNHATDEMIAA
jgi:hypothetical protein